MDKLDLHTPDLTAANIARLAELFPNCVTETRDAETGGLKQAVDFDLLRQELSADAIDAVEGPAERYRLDWPGKRAALATANAPIRKTLRPARGESVDFDSTRNLYIEGDNLDALKLLQETYLGQVKMIYIDPPYNTGKDFIYSDKFSRSAADELRESGQTDDEGQRLVANTESNGRFHSDWLSMMYPRLKLARNLLREDGVIFISIDDNEVHNLRKMCDEVFGEENFLAQFIWKCRNFTDARAISKISTDHEYLICYARKAHVSLRGVPRDETKYKNPDNDPRGPWMSRSILGLAAPDQRPNLHYSITDPETKISYDPPADNGWRYGKERMFGLINEGSIIFPNKPEGRPREKKYREDIADDFTSFPSWIDDIHTSHGTETIRDLFASKLFDFPKPHQLVQKFIEQAAVSEDLILDFFSGSASTAHAVMQLNAEDGGNRRHIMVQLPEVCDEKSAAAKAGYSTIAEIGKERIRRAAAKIRGELQAKIDKEDEGSEARKELQSRLAQLDTGFRVLKIDTPTYAGVHKSPDELTQDDLDIDVENIKPDRSHEDLLFQVLLDWGVELSLEIENLELGIENAQGKPYQIFSVGDSAETEDAQAAIIACFEPKVSEDLITAIARKQPLRAVFRDASFPDDAAKINAEQLFKHHSPHTELKTL